MAPPKKHPPYSGCETGGRPRKYTVEEIETFADELITWMKKPTNIWFKDFCLDKDLDPDLMSSWSKESNKFFGAYKLAKARQESRLINGGLMETLNGGLVKFVLANAHGWSDKQESKISGDAAHPLAFLMQKADGMSKDLINE